MNLPRVILGAAFALAVCSCAGSPLDYRVDVSDDGPTSIRGLVVRVCERTDAYVATDESLEDVERSQVHASIGRLQSAVTSQDRISGWDLEPLATPVLDLHDAYVGQDTALQPFERSIYLDSTAALRMVLESATRGPP